MALILTASHDQELLRTMATALERLRHRVVSAPTTQFALNWLAETDTLPDLIVVDVGLRTFQGFELVEILKSASCWKNVPILVQTKSKCLDIFEHCDGTLQKPFSPQELTRMVSIILQTRDSLKKAAS